MVESNATNLDHQPISDPNVDAAVSLDLRSSLKVSPVFGRFLLVFDAQCSRLCVRR